MWVGDNAQEDRLAQMSQQVLNGREHVGNIWPIVGPWSQAFHRQALRIMSKVPNAARADGMGGWMGIDMGIVTSQVGDNAPAYRVPSIESNARFSGSLPGKMIEINNGLHRTETSASYGGNIVNPTSSEEDFYAWLDREKLRFSPDKNGDHPSVIPHNFVGPNGRKVHALVRASSREQLVDVIQTLGVQYTTNLLNEESNLV